MTFADTTCQFPTFHTVPEVARILRVSERTVARLMQDGTIRSIKIKGRRLIPAAEIKRLAKAT
jgi:excisionase family DNA binding protein